MNRAQVLNTLVTGTLSADAGIHAAFVEGDAGSGKSYLLHEVSRSLTEKATVLVGECLATGTPPLLPLCTAIAGSARLRRDAESAALIRRYVEAIPLVKDWLAPALQAGADTVLAPTSLLGSAPPASFVFLALSRLLRRAAKSRPVVLLVDDVQWIDDSTMAILELLVREGAEGVLLVGLFSRTGESGGPVGTLKEAVRRAGVRVTLDTSLDELSREEFLTVIEQVTGGALVGSTEALDQLRTQANGNPLYAQELARLLMDRGDIVRREGLFVLSAGVDTGLRPPSLRRLTQSRVEAAIGGSDTRRRMLFALAVLGRFSSVEHVAVVAGIGVANVLSEASEVMRRTGLLSTERHSGSEHLVFEHDVVRESVLEMIGGMRPLFHASAARSLAADAAVEPSTIAKHLEAARDLPAAAEWWGRAAEAGLARYAVPDAISFAGRAESLVSDSFGKVNAAVRTARCLLAAERYEAVIDHLRPLLPIASDEDFAVIALCFCRAALRIPRSSSHRAAIDVATSALRRSGDLLPLKNRCEYRLTLVCLYDAVGDHPRAKANFQRARADARASGDARLISRSERLGCIFAQPEIMLERLAFAASGLDLAADVAELGYVANNRGTALLQLNRLVESLESLERASEHLRVAGGYRADVPLNNQGVVLTMQDRIAAAGRAFQEARDRSIDPHNRIFIDVNIAVVDAMEGRHARAESALRVALASAVSSGDDFYIDICSFNLSTLLVNLSRFGEAIEILEAAPLRVVTTDEVLVRGQRARLAMQARQGAGLQPDPVLEDDIRRLGLSTKPQAWLYTRTWHLCDIEFWED